VPNRKDTGAGPACIAPRPVDRAEPWRVRG